MLIFSFVKFRIQKRKESSTLNMNSFKHQIPSTLSEKPRKLKFIFQSSILKAIDKAHSRLTTAISKQDLAVLQFNHFGKSTIKTFQLSPDSFVQVAIQFAYYKKFGYNRATYESAQTRKFYHGRTETVRSCTKESSRFIQIMIDTTNPSSIREKFDALKKAIIHHSELMNEAIEGQGIDRHFLGLKLLLKREEGELAEIFDDPAFLFSHHWFLSTSQLTSEYFENKGWGEVVSDGFGIGYMIKNHSLHFNVTSQHLNSREMCYYLESSLMELFNLCKEMNVSSQL